jgi:glutamine amidotransferase
MTAPRVAIVDIRMGNVRSVDAALRFVGADPRLVSEPDELETFDFLVLPGVGSFRTASERLDATGLGEAIVARVRGGAALLGICLGMQLLGTSSTEDGLTGGLRLLDMTVDKFGSHEVGGAPLPNIGFAPIDFDPNVLMAGISPGSDFYFVHSYRVAGSVADSWVATARYGVEFVAAVSRGSVFGTQFHPEKSQGQGLRLLANFVGGC